MKRLPVIPVVVHTEVQLVLGLPLGIKTKRARRRPSAWLRPTGKAA
jgi:hypothetical protein